MEFEEMKKIWDTQNNEPIYAIDEAALHQRIQAKRNRAKWNADLTEVGLVVIAIVVSSFLFIKNRGGYTLYAFLPAIAILLTAVYVLVGRLKRIRVAKQFDRSILGDLDEAISHLSFEINRSRIFMWWYTLPLCFSIIPSMVVNDTPPWKWVVLLIGFFLSYMVVQLGLRYKQLPRRRELEALREKLIE